MRILLIDMVKVREFRFGKLFPLNVISTEEMYGWVGDNLFYEI
jgi:hypothetical protein